MTPDREPDESVLDRDTTDHVGGEAAGAAPVLRPEVLARVLTGLRELPAAPVDAGGGGGGDGGSDEDPSRPLPRRR